MIALNKHLLYFFPSNLEDAEDLQPICVLDISFVEYLNPLVDSRPQLNESPHVAVVLNNN